MTDLRPSPIAGTWYPSGSDALKQSIDRYMDAAQVKPPQGKIIGIVVPHAGHRYSGGVAAHAFRCVQGMQPSVVAVVSPLHQAYSGRLFTSDHEAYATPLGTVRIDHARLQQLEQHLPADVQVRPIRNDQEHAIEIELPFLQRVLSPMPTLLPIMMRDQSRPMAKALGHALAQTLAHTQALLVASTDLSHFYPASTARNLDSTVLARIEAFDPDGVIKPEEQAAGLACGHGALAAILWAARDLGANRASILKYANSGDITGDQHSVVGYGAAVLIRAEES